MMIILLKNIETRIKKKFSRHFLRRRLIQPIQVKTKVTSDPVEPSSSFCSRARAKWTNVRNSSHVCFPSVVEVGILSSQELNEEDPRL